MFRNPRENASRTLGHEVKPYVGRPPSPHSIPAAAPGRMGAAEMATATPRIGRTSAPRIRPQFSAPKNGSILNFFKKADSNGQAADPLFLDGANFGDGPGDDAAFEVDGGEQPDGQLDNGQMVRFNESGGSNKRRKLSLSPSESKDAEAQRRPDASGVGEKACSPPPPDFDDEKIPSPDDEAAALETSPLETPARRSGPFVEDSDSEDEDRKMNGGDSSTVSPHREQVLPNDSIESNVKEEPAKDPANTLPRPPDLSRQSTSMAEDTFADFEGMEDFDDEYEEGDEFMEKRYQREQRRLERGEGQFEGEFEEDDFEGMPSIKDGDLIDGPRLGEDTAPRCPICSASFAGASDQEASVHVNHCLDGNPTPLPSAKLSTKPDAAAKIEPIDDIEVIRGPTKFRRSVRPAKPGQENPFILGEGNGTSSAFSRLMSGKAEDNAWATAAAAENASRGRPAYERTCPFYKILPGFNICVDAFRYGAVQGCKAYFLSHFHSDHYIGLTSTWCHGPIYCSRPTANLVRQQLRVDPKWVIDLEFEREEEVPGTNGVRVTMIPANHCPGSSLYLFEKTIGQGQNPKIQRVLHCGDFRACPAHIEHPLLRPDVVDSISGKTRQQKIDVCYLDTTYLNPKYAFPSQEEVIRACADMCVSLNKTKVDKDDTYEQMKTSRAGGAMSKFIRQDSMDDTHSEDTLKKAEPEAELKDGAQDTSPKLPVKPKDPERGQLLVVIGTYSIGKERICLGIARALNSLIYAPPGKQRIVRALEDEELLSRMTSDPRKAQVHMTPLFEIRAETLGDYLADYRDSFSRVVGFRPSGWNYRPPGSRFTESPAVHTVLYSDNWKSGYGMRDLVPQRGSNGRAATYGVPYSEHSSFRELTMFCCGLRIEKVVPTVNVGSAKSREKMKVWVDRWNAWKRKEGLFKIRQPEEDVERAKAAGLGEWYAGKGTWALRTTL